MTKHALNVTALLVCLSCTACAVGPDYKAPDLSLPQNYAAAKGVASAAESTDPQWWTGLHDPLLNSLIDKTLTGNLDIESAVARLEQAREAEIAIAGEALPTAGLSAGGGLGTGNNVARSRVSAPLGAGADTRITNNVNSIAGFDAVWELDLFGKFRREAEAAHDSAEAAKAAHDAVLTAVIADVARAYIDLRALQTKRSVLAKSEGVAKEYLDVAQQRYDRGITNELDVALAQRQLYSLQAEDEPLNARIDAAKYALATLIGIYPENLTQELDQPGAIPSVPDPIALGGPLDLLRRRADVIQAERELAGATAKIGVETANLFPHLTFSSGAGYQNNAWAVLSGGSQFIASAGPSLDWNLLDFGTLDAAIKIADWRSQEKLAQYKKTVLNAVREVDTATLAFQAQQDSLRKLGLALESSRSAVTLASKRYNRGLTDSLNVIDAERQEYIVETQYVAAKQLAAEDFVALHKALGGGWERQADAPMPPTPRPAIIAAIAAVQEIAPKAVTKNGSEQ